MKIGGSINLLGSLMNVNKDWEKMQSYPIQFSTKLTTSSSGCLLPELWTILSSASMEVLGLLYKN